VPIAIMMLVPTLCIGAKPVRLKMLCQRQLGVVSRAGLASEHASAGAAPKP
jgi:hypothetical protein